MTERLHVRGLDPAGGVAGQAPVIAPDGLSVAWSTVAAGGGGGGGGGASFAVLDQSHSQAGTTLSTSGVIWSRTITAAPAGTYLLIGSYWTWSGTGFGSVQFRKGGVGLNDEFRTDPGREGTPSERPIHGLAIHTGGDLVLDLYFSHESGTVTFGTGSDTRFGRHINIIGPLSGGGGGTTTPVITRYPTSVGTSDIVVNWTTFTAMSSTLDIVIPGLVAGDVVEFGMNGRATSHASAYLQFDVASIVSGSIVNRFLGGLSDGIPAFCHPAGTGFSEDRINGSDFWTVQAGDLSAGTLTLRWYTRLASAGSRTIYARNPSIPLTGWGRSCGSASASSNEFLASRVTRSADLALAAGTNTTVTWDVETYDTHGFHDLVTNPARFTVPAGRGGYYRVTGRVTITTSTSARANASLMKNGSQVTFGSAYVLGGNYGTPEFTELIPLVAGDYLEVVAWSGTAGTIEADGSSFTIERVG